VSNEFATRYNRRHTSQGSGAGATRRKNGVRRCRSAHVPCRWKKLANAMSWSRRKAAATKPRCRAVFAVFLKPWLGITLDGIDGTFRLTNPTVDTFVRMDYEHILALVEAVHGAHCNAVHGFAANTAIVDDVSQFSTPKSLRNLAKPFRENSIIWVMGGPPRLCAT
jgi:hypothetical protein